MYLKVSGICFLYAISFNTLAADTASADVDLEKKLSEYEQRLEALEQEAENKTAPRDRNQVTGNLFNPAISVILDDTDGQIKGIKGRMRGASGKAGHRVLDGQGRVREDPEVPEIELNVCPAFLDEVGQFLHGGLHQR